MNFLLQIIVSIFLLLCMICNLLLDLHFANAECWIFIFIFIYSNKYFQVSVCEVVKLLGKIDPFLFYCILFNYFLNSVTIVCIFSPSFHCTPASPTSLPHLYPRPWLCPCVLYSSSYRPLSPLSPPHSPLAIVTLFFGTGEHYAKWNKPGGEGQIPYDLIFNWNIINKRKKQTKYNQTHWKEDRSFWQAVG